MSSTDPRDFQRRFPGARDPGDNVLLPQSLGLLGVALGCQQQHFDMP